MSFCRCNFTHRQPDAEYSITFRLAKKLVLKLKNIRTELLKKSLK